VAGEVVGYQKGRMIVWVDGGDECLSHCFLCWEFVWAIQQ